MINLSAFKHNYTIAKKICCGPIDVLKYIVLVYSSSKFLPISQNSQFTIKFDFGGFLGKISLTMRNNSGSDTFIFSEVFGLKCYDIDLPFTPKTILDLGGNIGLSTIYFARKYPTSSIATVEPMQNNLDILYRNIAVNNLIVDVVPTAVATVDGSVEFCITELDYDHHILTDDQQLDEENVLSIDAKSIPSIMLTLDWSRINLLKMDIEGYEKVLLTENAEWLSLVDALCIEVHGDYTGENLYELSKLHKFSDPIEIPGGLWLLVKKDVNDKLDVKG